MLWVNAVNVSKNLEFEHRDLKTLTSKLYFCRLHDSFHSAQSGDRNWVMLLIKSSDKKQWKEEETNPKANKPKKPLNYNADKVEHQTNST